MFIFSSLVFWFGAAADCYTTWVALEGGGARESNPIFAPLIARFGYAGAFAVRLGFSAFVFAATLWLGSLHMTVMTQSPAMDTGDLANLIRFLCGGAWIGAALWNRHVANRK